MRSLLTLLALLPLLACAATPPAPAPEETYTLAFLCSGDMAAYKSVEERRDLQAGHMANINRLAEARLLLVAGPFGRPNPQPQRRGLFIFDVRDQEQAAVLAESDPAVQGGVLRFETYPLRTRANLRGALELHFVEEKARREQGSTESGMRTYVLLLAHEGERALQQLAGRTEVLLSARLGGAWEGKALVLLDAKDAQAAKDALGPVEAALGPHEWLPWFSTVTLARLPGL